jgi:hypothetical protein
LHWFSLSGRKAQVDGESAVRRSHTQE